MEDSELGTAGTGAVDISGITMQDVMENLKDAGFRFGEAVRGRITQGFAVRLGITAGIIAGQALLIWLVWFLFKKLITKIKAGAGKKIKPLVIRNFKILSSMQIIEVILFSLRILKYLLTAFQLFITVPIVFSLFPATEELASTIFGYVLSPLKSILLSMVRFIPNIITIIIILLVAKYAVRGLKFLATQIDKGKMKIPGFYADWAWPTFNILRVLLYAFTVAVIYPYLPGSESRVFQGVSVFVGIIFSLGSSSAIGNLIAGLVITYMRTFKIGDRIKIKDFTGFVVEKSPFVIRLRNIKNENITFPNLTVLNSEIINYNTSGEEEGLILHVDITMGYDVPWRELYDALIRAAVKTPHIEESPKPFVQQTGFDDFCAKYELNVYTKEIERVVLIYSLLYQNIQDEFKNAGIDLFVPHYEVSLQGTYKHHAQPEPAAEDQKP